MWVATAASYCPSRPGELPKLNRMSGQTKQFFGRNTETETGPSEKAEISAETETASFGRNTFFRGTFWPNFCCQNSSFRLKEAVLAKKVFRPKVEKEESRNTETETYFGRNRTETVSVCPLGCILIYLAEETICSLSLSLS